MTRDDNQSLRGCSLASMCSLCNASVEIAEHLFLSCSFSKAIWNWLNYVLDCHIDLSSMHTVLQICNRSWSPQLKDIVLSAVVNVVWAIWQCRNKCRFDNKITPYESVINMVAAAAVSISGNLSKGIMSDSI